MEFFVGERKAKCLAPGFRLQEVQKQILPLYGRMTNKRTGKSNGNRRSFDSGGRSAAFAQDDTLSLVFFFSPFSLVFLFSH
jgi:hypothetical protein